MLLRTMVSAANADHEIDTEERRQILQKVELLGLDDEERQFLDHEFSRPCSLDALADALAVQAPGEGRGALARQMYAVAVIVAGSQNESERLFLGRLARKLGLDAATQSGIERRLVAGTAAGPA